MRKLWAKLYQFGLLLAQKGHGKEARAVLKLGHYVPEESAGVPSFWRRNYDYGEGFYHGDMSDKEPLGEWRKKHKGKGPNWPKKKRKKTAQTNRLEKSLEHGITLVLLHPSATYKDHDTYSVHFEKDGNIAYEDCGADILGSIETEHEPRDFSYLVDWVLLEGSAREQVGSDKVLAYSAESLLDKVAELPFVQQVLEWEAEESEWQKLPEEEKQKWREDFKKGLQTRLREKAETPTPEELEEWFRESKDK